MCEENVNGVSSCEARGPDSLLPSPIIAFSSAMDPIGANRIGPTRPQLALALALLKHKPAGKEVKGAWRIAQPVSHLEPNC